MSNIKQVDVRGTVPFNYYEDEKLSRQMALLQSPSIGTSVTFRETESKPNEHGGRTAMYIFEVQGYEALRFEWLQAFKVNVERVGGEVYQFSVVDFETKEVLS